MQDYVIFSCPASLSFTCLIEEAFKREWRSISGIPVVTIRSNFKRLGCEPSCRGVVMPISKHNLLDMAKEIRSPIVNLSERLDPVPLAINLRYDHDEIGALAAAHLLDNGYSNFFFLGDPPAAFSGAREKGFERALQRRNHRLSASFSFAIKNKMNPLMALQNDADQVQQWMEQIGQTGGILAANDRVAVRFLRALRACLPEMAETIGLVGIDDDFSRLTDLSEGEPITSILPNFSGAGTAAARLIGMAVNGQDYNPGSSILISGAKLIERQTTGGVVCADLLLTRITRWISGEVNRGRSPTVAEVIARFPMSERTLSEKFRRAGGESMRDFIMNKRVQRAARLLLDSDKKISEIAQLCGFNKHADLTERFKQRYGKTPSDFRQEACL